MSKKVIIVGAGLFGSIAAALAQRAGREVMVIDAKNDRRASRCSGNLFKRSWLDALSKEDVEAAYKTLDSLYGIKDFEEIGLSWVDPEKVLLKPDMVGAVTEVGNGWVNVAAHGKIEGKVLVAAGVWSDQLVRMPSIKPLVGASLRIKGQISVPRTKLYAPYKQATVYNINKKEVWAGDGAAILYKNWDEETRLKLLRTRVKALGVRIGVDEAEVRVGMRPYVPNFKTGYFVRTQKNTWVSTGGAKNGLVLAAVLGQRFVKELR